MSGNKIPAYSRSLVTHRSRGRCERCGGLGSQWHHRRSRRVRAEHRHCACNGVWLCGTCHLQVHQKPERESNARRDGFMLSQWVAIPGDTLVKTPWGDRFHDCEGGYRHPLIETGATDDEHV